MSKTRVSVLRKRLRREGLPDGTIAKWRIVRVEGCPRASYTYEHDDVPGVFRSAEAAIRAHAQVFHSRINNEADQSDDDEADDDDDEVDDDEVDDDDDEVDDDDDEVDDDGEVHDQSVELVPAGSARAVQLLASAEWRDAAGARVGGPRGPPAIADTTRPLLDVLLVDPDMDDTGPAPCDWHAQALVERHGYRWVSRPTAVLARDGAAVYVLAVYVRVGGSASSRATRSSASHAERNAQMELALSLPSLSRLPARVEALHASLATRMPSLAQRPGIRMFGCRWNRQGWCRDSARERLRTGWYPAVSRAAALELTGDEQHRLAVVSFGEDLCALERELAPAAAAHRVDHARRSGHVGLWPGVDTVRVPAAALGVSRGYASPPHVDMGFAGMAEAITWSSRGVPTEARYCFAVVAARVVFDLSDACGGVAVLVPGHVRHGTPRLAPGHGGAVVHDPRRSNHAPRSTLHATYADHAGLGAVVLNKSDLVEKDEARRDCAELRWRVERGVLSNAFLTGSSLDVADAACVTCRARDGADSMLLCDLCNEPRHVHCAGLASVPRGGYLCARCARVAAQN
jgi:hypothetical protein